jgi:hypothetical protein
MIAARSSGAGTHCERTRDLGLTGSGLRRAFLVADANPLDLAASDHIGKWIERVADQSKDVPDADLFKCTYQNAGNCL